MNAITRKLQSAITVRDLIDELSSFPDDTLVLFGCDYGDRGHTEQALPVSAVDPLDDFEELVESSYSQSRVAIHETEEDQASETDNRDYVILR